MSWTSPSDPAPLREREELDSLLPYSAATKGGTPVTVRASSNEASDGVSPAVLDAVTRRLATINRYPQLGLGDLAATIAEHVGAAPDEVIAADGSLSVLNYLLLTYCPPGSQVVMAWRSYEAYPICVRTAGAQPVAVPNSPDGGHDLPAILAAIGPQTSAVLLCTPNNPTGTAIAHDALAAFIEQVPQRVLVVVDEAYLDFATAGDVVRTRELMAHHGNVVSLRTFSKAWGLAGIRVGYLVASAAICLAVRKILPPFPVNALAEAAIPAALTDPAFRRRIVTTAVGQRAEVFAVLDRHGLPHSDSQANFVWLPLGERSDELGALCARLGMSTRVFTGEGIRISLGEPDVVPTLARALELFPRD